MWRCETCNASTPQTCSCRKAGPSALDLDALERLFDNVPQGPWRDDGRGCFVFCGKTDEWTICQIRGWGHLTGRGGGQHLTDEDATEIQTAIARYIAGVSPSVLSALLDRLRQAEAERDAAKRLLTIAQVAEEHWKARAEEAEGRIGNALA